jgi:hypothetical protein
MQHLAPMVFSLDLRCFFVAGSFYMEVFRELSHLG